MAAKKVLVSWRSLGEPERSRVVTFIGGRKELYTEILSKFSDVFEVASSLFCLLHLFSYI